MMDQQPIERSLKTILMLDRPVALVGGLSVGAIVLILVIITGYSLGKDAALRDNRNDRIAQQNEMRFTQP